MVQKKIKQKFKEKFKHFLLKVLKQQFLHIYN